MSYKHLGSINDYRRSRAEENALRITQTIVALTKLSRPLKTSYLKSPHTWPFCASLAVTKLLYDAWPDSGVNKSSHASIEAIFNSAARRCSNNVGVHIPNEFAVACCRAIPYEYHLRLIISGSTFLHRMLEYLAATPNSFLQLVTDDLKWFFTAKELVISIPDIEGGLADTVAWISDNHEQWTRTRKRHKK